MRQNLEIRKHQNFFITVYQFLARGLFKRVDGVIAYPEEITNPRLSSIIDPATLQLLRALQGY
jgi:hypothetical protein